MKTIISIIIVLVLLVGIFIALDQIKVPEPKASSTPVVATATPTPETGTEGNIRVFSPTANTEIGLPVVIKGEARTFEAAFSYRIKNSKGEVLIEGHSTTTGEGDIGDFRTFEVSVNYSDPKTASGSIEVFEYSAKDGSEINKVIVPVNFAKVEGATNVKIYVDLEKSINTRIPKTETPIRATLDELFKWLTTDVKIESVAIASGVLTVDLSGTVSAEDQARITKTAMQYASVKSIVFK